MVERQPNRPTVEEFTGAALRFIKGDYLRCDPPLSDEGKAQLQATLAQQGFRLFNQRVRDELSRTEDIEYVDERQRRNDWYIIIREQRAVGMVPDHDDLEDFCIEQLAGYAKKYHLHEDI